jgi:MFS superfamily sulfate permease-like transporter
MVRSFTHLTSLTMIALGVAMIVVTLTHGVGVGLLLGALFIAAGSARLYMIRRRG